MSLWSVRLKLNDDSDEPSRAGKSVVMVTSPAAAASMLKSSGRVTEVPRPVAVTTIAALPVALSGTVTSSRTVVASVPLVCVAETTNPPP